VLVTGASSGIGEAIAIRFAQEGANVAMNYHSGQDRAEAVKAKALDAAKGAGYTVNCFTVQADVSDEAQVIAMFATAVKHSRFARHSHQQFRHPEERRERQSGYGRLG
jgi:glucose 1-dehydrogenase